MSIGCTNPYTEPTGPIRVEMPWFHHEKIIRQSPQWRTLESPRRMRLMMLAQQGQSRFIISYDHMKTTKPKVSDVNGWTEIPLEGPDKTTFL